MISKKQLEGFQINVRTDRTIVIKENRSSCIFNNPDEKMIEEVKIDTPKCPIKGKKCDYMIIPTRNNLYFIELKGQNVKHAYEQIKSTVHYFKCHSSQHINKKFIIIATKFPKATTSSQRLMQIAKKELRGDLIIKTKVHIVDL